MYSNVFLTWWRLHFAAAYVISVQHTFFIYTCKLSHFSKRGKKCGSPCAAVLSSEYFTADLWLFARLGCCYEVEQFLAK